MDNKLILSGTSTLMLLLLLTSVGWISSVYAQGNLLNISGSQIANLEKSLAQVSNTTTKEIISSIITPWNTGNK